MKTITRLTLCAFATTLVSCLSMQTPDKFLITREGWSELKALTPDDAKLWVREFKDDKRGDLDFWSEALREEFETHRGYVILEDPADIVDGAQRPGKQFLMEVTTDGITWRYLLNVFVIEGWRHHTIRVAEYVAHKDDFDEYLASVKDAIRTLE
ncbi:MAG: hypothetical protein AAF517_13195 [Planctomycetota bacterium]